MREYIIAKFETGRHEKCWHYEKHDILTPKWTSWFWFSHIPGFSQLIPITVFVTVTFHEQKVRVYKSLFQVTKVFWEICTICKHHKIKKNRVAKKNITPDTMWEHLFSHSMLFLLIRYETIQTEANLKKMWNVSGCTFSRTQLANTIFKQQVTAVEEGGLEKNIPIL